MLQQLESRKPILLRPEFCNPDVLNKIFSPALMHKNINYDHPKYYFHFREARRFLKEQNLNFRDHERLINTALINIFNAFLSLDFEAELINFDDIFARLSEQMASVRNIKLSIKDSNFTYEKRSLVNLILFAFDEEEFATVLSNHKMLKGQYFGILLHTLYTIIQTETLEFIGLLQTSRIRQIRDAIDKDPENKKFKYNYSQKFT